VVAVQHGKDREGMAISSRTGLRRILVVYAAGDGGERALARGAEAVGESGAELTVVALAPQDTRPAHCVVGTPAYNEAVRDEAAGELERAQGLLGALEPPARFKLLIGGRDPDLAAWARVQAFELILLPGGGGLLGSGARRLARGLRRGTRSEVRTT
jgi:hypothetical protein